MSGALERIGRIKRLALDAHPRGVNTALSQVVRTCIDFEKQLATHARQAKRQVLRADAGPADCAGPATVCSDTLNDSADRDQHRCDAENNGRRFLPKSKRKSLLDRNNMTIPVKDGVSIDAQFIKLVHPNAPHTVWPSFWRSAVERNFLKRSFPFVFPIAHPICLHIATTLRANSIATNYCFSVPSPKPREAGR